MPPRIFLLLLVYLSLPLTSPSLANPYDTFFSKRCFECHDDLTQKGGLDLLSLSPDLSNPDTLHHWILVHDRIRDGEMPPPERDRPPAAEIATFLASLAANITSAESQLIAAHGPARLRRMNRAEYEHTLQDLLGLPMLRVREMLPEDSQKHGFDKLPGALDISHVQLTSFVEAADKALRQAITPQSERPPTSTWREPASHQHSALAAISIHAAAPLLDAQLAPGLGSQIRGNPVADMGNTYRAATFDPSSPSDSLAILARTFGAHQPQGIQPDRFATSYPGWYHIRFSTWGLRWESGDVLPAARSEIRTYRHFAEPYTPHETERWRGTLLPEPQISTSEENTDLHGDAPATHVVRASLEGALIGYFDAPSLQPTKHEFKVWLEPGQKLSFHFMSLPANGPPNWPSANGVFSYDGPGIAIDWFEIEGPLLDEWPPLGHRRLFGAAPSETIDLLTNFAALAFRRPVSAEELAPYLALAEAQLAAGNTPQDALLAGHKAILCSPDFLFLGLEGDRTLASRLSYFLWSSLPDEELLSLAASGKLATPDILRAQVDRMLDDPRSARFVDHFLDRWLDLAKIDFTTPDPQLYPEFDPWLRDSMLAETRAYFRLLLDQDKGIAHLVDSDFILLDQRLAELYQIPGVAGAQLRPVPVPPSIPRGGLLTQAAILKVTADGTATSPVHRGAWVTTRILGIPLRPPPPNIPAIDPDASAATSTREQLLLHRADPSCASCHQLMDPPGFALESFDVIGNFRQNYRAGGRPAMRGNGDERQLEPHLSILNSNGNRSLIRLGPEVDPSGALTDGRTFSDVEDLKALLLADESLLARNFARQLALYAAGRGHSFSDRPLLDDVVSRSAPSGYGLRSILHHLVQSPLFLEDPQAN